MQDAAQRVVRLGAPPERLGEARRTDGSEHELLEVDVGVGMGSAVEDVHQREREHVCVRATDVAIEGQLTLGCRGLRDGQRDPEDRVGAEPRLGVGAVELDQRRVEAALIERLDTDDRFGDLVVDVGDRVLDPLASEALAAVAAARPLRGRRCWPRSAPRPGPVAPEASSTSTSTVGLPRESRISRPVTSTMMLTAAREVGGRRSETARGEWLVVLVLLE